MDPLRPCSLAPGPQIGIQSPETTVYYYWLISSLLADFYKSLPLFVCMSVCRVRMQ